MFSYEMRNVLFLSMLFSLRFVIDSLLVSACLARSNTSKFV